MDNATFHKKHNIQQVIIGAGYMVEYLPTYSPDLNPIEHKWAQAKSKKKREWLRYRDFVLSPYGVIKIKSPSYRALGYEVERIIRSREQVGVNVICHVKEGGSASRNKR
ncbi:transposase [Symbiopectobacterium sp. RP]|uniref:transposase n=1 Tax=Symbiopectobacterium sp. RP TaxID=3248553 RepID=UPI003D2DABB1